MAAILHQYVPNRVIDSNGISDGASIAFYLTGTLDPAVLYSDAFLSMPRANPVVVAAGAEVPDFYIDTNITYRRVITFSDGSTDDTDPFIAVDHQAVLTALADAQEAAEESADSADASADSATESASSAGLAQSAASQAEIAAAASNTDGIYVDEPTGRAAVANGEYFWVPSANGQTLWRRVDAGSSTNVMTMPSLGATGPRQFIKCVASTSGYSNNDFEIVPIDTTTVYSGTGINYIWVFEAPSANKIGSGGVSITIKNGAGATFFTTTLRKFPGITVMEPNEYRAGDLMYIRRSTVAEDAGQPVLWLSTTDRATENIANWAISNGQFGKKMSTQRQLRYLKRHTNTHDIFMRWTEDKYLNGQSRRASDEIRVVEFDQTQYANLSEGNSLSLNSFMTSVRGLACNDLNMQFTTLIEGLTVDTGRPPTAIEPPAIGGDYTKSVSTFEVSGPPHNNYIDVTTVLTGTYADPTTSEVDTDVDIDPNADIGNEFYGDKLVKVASMLCTEDAGDVYCRLTQTVTYDPAATDQIRIQSEFDFTDGDITVVTPGFLRGFALVGAFTDVDRCQAIVNGVKQTIQTLDLRDNSSIVIGFPEAVYFWHSDFPEKQIVVTNNAGYGYTHRENGVLVANSIYPSYISNFHDGPYTKLYGGMYGDHGAGTAKRDMTGIVVTSDFSHRFILADPRTNP